MVKTATVALWLDKILKEESIDTRDYSISQQGRNIVASVGVPIKKLEQLSKKYHFELMDNSHSCGGPSGSMYSDGFSPLRVMNVKPQPDESSVQVCFYSTS